VADALPQQQPDKRRGGWVRQLVKQPCLGIGRDGITDLPHAAERVAGTVGRAAIAVMFQRLQLLRRIQQVLDNNNLSFLTAISGGAYHLKAHSARWAHIAVLPVKLNNRLSTVTA